jgi:N-acetylmuramate 1-kinase
MAVDDYKQQDKQQGKQHAVGDVRQAELTHWAADVLRTRGEVLDAQFALQPASDDASFRRYFRAGGDSSVVFMDAPPELEDSRPFVHVADLLRQADLKVPEVLALDLDRGFMALTDFGQTLYLDRLANGNASEVEHLYQAAFDSLTRLHEVDRSVAAYSPALLNQEMSLFSEWFLDRQLGVTAVDLTMIDAVFRLMVENAEEQPQIFVHRDFHSRNLMVIDNGPGIIDFQDAVVGPVTYDLVSLLKDCYYRFPRIQVENWVKEYHTRLTRDGTLNSVSYATFLRWFDLMGFQRHLKCAGIFSRLNLRDGKARYLLDIPLVVDYLCDVCRRYDELSVFGSWLREDIEPRIRQRPFVR